MCRVLYVSHCVRAVYEEVLGRCGLRCEGIGELGDIVLTAL
jgi:hypothetical protein